MRKPSAMPINFNGRARHPQPEPEPPAVADDEHVKDIEDPEDPFAEDDELAAMSPEDFYWHLRSQVDRVASGEMPGQPEDAHPMPKDRPWSKRHKRRDRYGRAF
jgi:hypothetical protein